MSAICIFDPNIVTEINFGDPSIDGTWKIIPVSNDLSIQKRESGVFVEKTAIQP